MSRSRKGKPRCPEGHKWPCMCGQQDYASGVFLPTIPIDPEHEALVDKLVQEAIRANRKT